MAFNWETIVQIILLIAALRLLHMVTASDSCSEVRRNFAAKRIGPIRMVPDRAAKADDLQVCPNSGLTCCTRAMENKFQAAAMRNVEKVMRYRTSSLNFIFRSFSMKFEEDIDNLLKQTHNSTNDLMKVLLETTREDTLAISLAELDRLFRELNFRSSHEDVTKAFERFGDKLFLAILVRSEEYEPSFEDCVSKQRRDLHPLMNTPSVIAINLSSALRLAQTLHEALLAGTITVNVTGNIELSKSCKNSLLSMQYCSHCFGLTLLKPCMGLCRNVFRGCFAGITELDRYWNYYITALSEVTRRMRSEESKYNLEVVLENFQNKLSSSISVLLENITALQETVDKRCKRTRALKRSKRAADLPVPELDVKNPRTKHKTEGRRDRHHKKSPRDRSLRTKELSKLKEELPPGNPVPPSSHTAARILPPHQILYTSPQKRSKETQQHLVESKRPKGSFHTRIKRFIASLNRSVNFYRHLPDDMCESQAGMAIEVSSDRCWDGSNIVDIYSKDVAPIGFEKQATNPEVKVLKVENGVMTAIEKLRYATKILFKSAGTMDVPGILLEAPVFERHDVDKNIFSGPGNWPCDDEDDCPQEGSGAYETDGGEKDFYPGTEVPTSHREEVDIDLLRHQNIHKNSKSRNSVKVLLDRSKLYNGTINMDMTEEEYEVSSNDRNKKGKNRKKNKKGRQHGTKKMEEGSKLDHDGNSAFSTTRLKFSAIAITVWLAIIKMMLENGQT